MIGRIAYPLVLLVSAVALINAEPLPFSFGDSGRSLSHHLTVGARESGDYLVLKQNVVEVSKRIRIVEVEKRFPLQAYERITQIVALDQKTNGNGATASVISGGPHTHDVTMKFESKRGHGINFVVEIYAKSN